jgi:hypothetical protein
MAFSKASSSSSSLSLESSSSSLKTYLGGEDLDFTSLTLLCHEASMLPFVEVGEERFA